VQGFVDQMVAAWITRARLLRLDGDSAAAFKVLDEAIGFAREHGFERLRVFAVAVHIQHALGDGKVDEAVRMGRVHGIDGPARQFLPQGVLTSRDEGRALSWVRLAIAGNRCADAIAVARQWHSYLETAGAVRSVIRWDILLANALMLSGERRAAQRALRRAIGIAGCGRFVRSFLDEGSWLQALLQEQCAAGIGAGGIDACADAFANELLAAFGPGGARAAASLERASVADVGIYGALGTREMEILQLMGAGMLNREIGEKTGMTEGSVKWYVQQIYDKIGVRRRAQVVDRAVQLGLIRK
jgi:LuxR family maltose regulon positive regulatory protein